MDAIQARLFDLRERGLYRRLAYPGGLDFASNDYLGLSRSEEIRARLARFLSGAELLGSTGSRLVSGENPVLRETEEFLAHVFSAPSALLFGSGYLANLGVTGALAVPGAEFFSDALNHASLIDGIRLTKCKCSVFRHNDLAHLQSLLSASEAPVKIIVTESVFSMDGDGPDIPGLRDLANAADAFLILDEAHAVGVLGQRGLGAAEEAGFESAKTAIVHTCGKALGGYGAFVTGSNEIRELIVNRGRAFIYSTAPPPLQAVQTRAAIELMLAEPERLQRLHFNVLFFSAELAKRQVPASGGHIVSVIIPGNGCVSEAAQLLEREGLFVKAIRSPTVPAGTERLRITIKAFHREADLIRLADLLSEILK